MRRKHLMVLSLLALTALALVACGTDDLGDVAGQAAPQDAVDTYIDTGGPADADVAEGLQLFRSIGCSGCHGQDGEGNLGPAMAGHTAEQVRRQVRTPSGDVMPAYSVDQLSDEQLDRIIAWIESLGPATAGDHHDNGHGDDDAESVGDHHHDAESMSDHHGDAESMGDHHDETECVEHDEGAEDCEEHHEGAEDCEEYDEGAEDCEEHDEGAEDCEEHHEGAEHCEEHDEGEADGAEHNEG